MEWYYTENDEKRGPVSEEEFQKLVSNGVITAQTLVWRDGMADWKSCELKLDLSSILIKECIYLS